MKKRIVADLGYSANPTGWHHLEITKAVLECAELDVDELFVTPCGFRWEKLTTNTIATVHRREMARLTFRHMLRIRLDLFDLEVDGCFTPTHVLDQRYNQYGNVIHIIGADNLVGGRNGQSYIHKYWQEWEFVWNNLHFAAILRDGCQLEKADLPPHCIVLPWCIPGSSTEIRNLRDQELPITGKVTPEVERYIDVHGLYLPQEEAAAVAAQ